jgi:hypothetical protein
MRRKFFFLALALCLALSLCACTGGQSLGPTDGGSSAVQSVQEPVPEPEPESFLIQYPGFVDQYFDSENHVLILSNSEDNQVDFLFELTDRKGTVLFQSEAVKPGEETGWDVSEHWEQNDHQLTITSTPVNEDGSLGNPVSQTITVTVELDE